MSALRISIALYKSIRVTLFLLRYVRTGTHGLVHKCFDDFCKNATMITNAFYPFMNRVC